MANSYTLRLRFVTQATGDNLNVWGATLNSQAIAMMDEAVAGVSSFTLSGAKVLTSANGASDESRRAVLNITGGTGGTVTAPSVTKAYLVRNATSGNVIVTTGAGSTAVIPSGDSSNVFCDGTNFFLAKDYNFAGERITGVGTPTASTDGATKAYADAVLVSANQYTDAVATASGNLPNQTGNSGKTLTTNGTAASWVTLSSLGGALVANNLSDLTNLITARSNLGLGNSATRDIGTTSGTVAAGDDSRILNALQKGLNLADVTSASSARTNLGLGAVATFSTLPVANGGTGSTTAAAARTALGLGTAAQQNSSAFLQTANNLSDLANIATALTTLGMVSGGIAAGSLGTSSFGFSLQDGGAVKTIIVKIGIVSTVAADTTATVTFAAAFPNVCLGLFPFTRVSSFSSSNDTAAQLVGTPTRFGGTVANQGMNGGASTIDIPYLAIGY